MPDTYSIKPQIYNISHANTNVDFVTKKILLVTHYIYTSFKRCLMFCLQLAPSL